MKETQTGNHFAQQGNTKIKLIYPGREKGKRENKRQNDKDRKEKRKEKKKRKKASTIDKSKVMVLEGKE